MNVYKNSYSKLFHPEYVFNLTVMIKIILAMLLIVTGKCLFAQHIQYSDKAKTTINNFKPAKPVMDSVVYHDWPDRCPAVSGSIPVLTNYVSRELVLKLTEIYKGHLYSITSLKADNDKLQYKLKVCLKGEIKFEYADETGNIITK
jgi:hypothetical protein